MYSGISYGEYLDTPQCRVSVDNVRMKFSYKYKTYDFEKRQIETSVDLLCHRLNWLYFDNCEVNWKTCDYYKIGNYAKICSIAGIDPFSGAWSCAVMIGRYVPIKGNKRVAPEIVFDFNPNKVPESRYVQIINCLRDGALHVSISRYDVAFDFPVSREQVILIRNDRQGYRLFSEVQKGVTEYQGERSHHNAMKLYDKTKESGLTVPVTRCEITVEGDYEKSIEQLFPNLIVLGNLQLNMDFETLPFAVKACLLHPDLMPMLKQSVDPKTYRRYRNMIADNSQQKLTPDNWDSVDQYISSSLTRLIGGVA